MNVQMPAGSVQGSLDVAIGAEALGQRSVDGVAADGFHETTDVAIARAGKGQSLSVNATNWYGPSVPAGATCQEAQQANGQGGLGDMVGMITSMFTGPMMRQVYGDRFHLTHAGAQAPSDRLALYSAIAMAMGKHPFGISVERGDVKMLGDAEAAARFAIPSGFRQVEKPAAAAPQNPMSKMPHFPHFP